jgi:phosphatidylglycerophosphate synthase
MFSVRARDAMLQRGGIASLAVFVRESWRDADEARRTHRPVVLAGVRLSFAFAVLATVAGAGWMVARHAPSGAFTIGAATIAAGFLAATLVWSSARTFVRSAAAEGPGRGLTRLGAANALTLLRFVLIGPVVVLLAEHHYRAALVVYGLLVFTDVVDGVIARARREESEFGVVMDPVADVVSTYAVFTVFAVDNLVPGWLYLLLTVRYVMLLVGSLGLFLATGGIEFRATILGKVVGVVQAAGVAVLMADAGGARVAPAVREVLFASLGLGFASIVCSQAGLGWMHWRRARRAM